MKHELNVWVIGGDLRQAKLAELLQNDEHTVHTYALERAPELSWEGEKSLAGVELADCVVLPLPVSGDGSMLNAPLAESSHPLTRVLDALCPGQIICAGRVDARTLAMAQERGLILYDYFAREELAVANAVPTALAVGHSSRLHMQRCKCFLNPMTSAVGIRPRCMYLDQRRRRHPFLYKRKNTMNFVKSVQKQ